MESKAEKIDRRKCSFREAMRLAEREGKTELEAYEIGLQAITQSEKEANEGKL